MMMMMMREFLKGYEPATRVVADPTLSISTFTIRDACFVYNPLSS
jgi:hypothetical protein